MITYKGVQKGRRIEVNGELSLIEDEDHPLRCGATVWVEIDTKDIVSIDGVPYHATT